MSKYFKKFSNASQYAEYINGNPYLPNVSFINSTQEVKYNPSSNNKAAK